MFVACGNNEVGTGREIVSFDAGPGDTGVPPVILSNATVGRRCINGIEQPFIVLSESAAICESHATFVATGTTAETAAFGPIDAASLGPKTVTATVCQAEQGCESRPIIIRLDSWTDGTGAAGGYTVDLPDGTRSEGDFTAAWCDYDQFASDNLPLASDIAIDAVKILQGTTVTLFENDTVPAVRNAPVVQLRPGLLRVFVRPLPNYVARTIVARLTLTNPLDPTPTILESRQAIGGPSQENSLTTTINFDLSPEAITGGLTWKVALYEVSACTPQNGGDIAQARAPRDDTSTPLQAESMGGTFRVVLVPIRYDADGSGRLPVLSEQQLDRFRNTMYAQYPISELDVTVREPVAYAQAVPPDSGASWSQLLNAVLDLRVEDLLADAPPDPRIFYYGLISPAATGREYCGEGCIAGVGPVTQFDGDEINRAAVGIGFEGPISVETFVHEIGHTLGRSHAPCTEVGPINGVDPDYPNLPAYDQALLGVSGYDPLEKELREAGDYHDMMSYCQPIWLSDYNYSAMFDRIQAVNTAASLVSWPPRDVRIAIVGDNDARWGSRRTVFRPNSEPVNVRFETATGQLVENATAERVELGDISYAFILVPDDPPPAAVQVRLPNGLTLGL